MNNDRIKVLTNIYLLQFDHLTAGEDDPRERWFAASACVRNWDMNAEDFESMFRRSMEEACRYLQPESGVTRPVDGILALCEAGCTEEVRQAFESLTEPTDIGSLQDRVQEFVKNMNALLEEKLPGQWRYRQRVCDGIGYLAFLDPADNYEYRASETALFAGYTEAEEEIGYERSFSLVNYYRLCNEVSLYLMSRNDVQDSLTQSLAGMSEERGVFGTTEDLAQLDPELHLLTADLIHNAYVHRFYEDKAANRKSRISTASQRRIDRARQQAMLLEKREVAAGRLDEVQVRETGAGMPNLEGRQVQHKAFGTGTVTVHDGKYLTVVFPKGTKKFALPGVVVNGYLTFEDADRVAAVCGEMGKIVAERRKLADELGAIDVQLRMLE